MWCCASKKEVKKPLRSAKQEPLSKVVLNLPPTVRLQYKKKWQGKIEQNKDPSKNSNPKNQLKQQNPKRTAELKNKIQELQREKSQIQQSLRQQQMKGKQIEEKISKAEAVSTVLTYMILKKEQQIDSFALKIKV